MYTSDRVNVRIEPNPASEVVTALNRKDSVEDVEERLRLVIAQIVNEADAFVKIHANGSANSEANVAMTICQTADNFCYGCHS